MRRISISTHATTRGDGRRRTAGATAVLGLLVPSQAAEDLVVPGEPIERDLEVLDRLVQISSHEMDHAPQLAGLPVGGEGLDRERAVVQGGVQVSASDMKPRPEHEEPRVGG